MDSSVEKIIGTTKEKSLVEFERMFLNTADRAAKTILKGVCKNERRVLIGLDAKVLDGMARVFPTGYQWLFTKAVKWRMHPS
ncbi:MAG: hypothetical protein ACJAWS_001321 [Oleiphilaceae bacterium]|jgi:hypothetical protein